MLLKAEKSGLLVDWVTDSQRDYVGRDPCPERPFKTPIVTFMKKAAGVEVDKWLTIIGTQFESYLGHISIARQETSVQPPKVR